MYALLLILAQCAEHSSCADQQLTCFSHLGVDICRKAVHSGVLGVQFDSLKGSLGCVVLRKQAEGLDKREGAPVGQGM